MKLRTTQRFHEKKMLGMTWKHKKQLNGFENKPNYKILSKQLKC